jgi:four helix bundle protein
VTRISGAEIQSYRDLNVWQLAMTLVVEVYRVSDLFPRDERFGLTSQLRRAAVSIAANIAEGQSRASISEYRHFISIARGGAAEVETELQIAERLRYVSAADIKLAVDQADHISRMLTKLRRSLVP